MSYAKKVQKPISWKPSIEISDAMQMWLNKNPHFDRALLLDMAVAEFIQKEHTLLPVVLVASSKEDVLKVSKKAIKKHKKSIDRLK